MQAKPIVGVTGPDRGGTVAWLFTRLAVWLQGGKTIRITPDYRKKSEKLDALILGGGADIHPERYGQHLKGDTGMPSPNTSGMRQWLIRIFSVLFYPFVFLLRKLFSASSPVTDMERDKLELGLLEKAIEDNIPVLGICRGAQLINVKLGGTLHQDIDGFYGEIPRIHSIWPKKKVNLDPESTLGLIFKKKCITVNALHHQAIENLASALKAVAKEENGIIQAIEMRDYPFMIGVQWHPEYMPQIREQRKIFKKLVDSVNRGERVHP